MMSLWIEILPIPRRVYVGFKYAFIASRASLKGLKAVCRQRSVRTSTFFQGIICLLASWVSITPCQLRAAGNQTIVHRTPVVVRARVIVDNDFGGDPDGLFSLAHLLLSPTMDVRGIIGSQNYKNGFYGVPGSAAYACEMVTNLLKAMHLSGKIAIYEGANSELENIKTPVPSDGAKFIVREAMSRDTKKPLYVLCGGGLSDIASAYLMEPKIAQRIRLIWIGGPEYPGLANRPPGSTGMEYNLGIDRIAAQVIFNASGIPLWQVPRNVYRQCLVSCMALRAKIGNKGALGHFLMSRLDDLRKRAKGTLGETCILGDSPLVLLTALQSPWNPDPSSSQYVLMPAPIINDSGAYQPNPAGRKIRVYTHLDVRLMLDDFYAKVAAFSVSEKDVSGESMSKTTN